MVAASAADLASDTAPKRGIVVTAVIGVRAAEEVGLAVACLRVISGVRWIASNQPYLT